jgi:hypothetical protein
LVRREVSHCHPGFAGFFFSFDSSLQVSSSKPLPSSSSSKHVAFAVPLAEIHLVVVGLLGDFEVVMLVKVTRAVEGSCVLPPRHTDLVGVVVFKKESASRDPVSS